MSFERIFKTRNAYKRLFRHDENGPSPDVATVLRDLKRFAGLPRAPVARDSQGRVDPVASAQLAGRQEVVNRIIETIHLDDKYFLNLREQPDD